MWLAARPVETIFSVRHLSHVTGLLLDDGRRVVVKVRPAAARLQSCAYVQQHLWRAGFPCPEPLAGPVPFGPVPFGPVPFEPAGALVASAEMILDGGSVQVGSAADHAELLARLIRLAPAADDVHSLADAPPWTAWDHGGASVWPAADDRGDDLNAHPETGWLDDLGHAVRVRLSEATAGVPIVVGHGDWEAQNMRWHGAVPVAVHDWDSVIAAPEAVIVGLAAAVWPAGVAGVASVDQTSDFIESYGRAAGRLWSPAEVEAAWAAGLWVRAFNAKKAALDGVETLTPAEAAERAEHARLWVTSRPRTR